MSQIRLTSMCQRSNWCVRGQIQVYMYQRSDKSQVRWSDINVRVQTYMPQVTYMYMSQTTYSKCQRAGVIRTPSCLVYGGKALLFQGHTYCLCQISDLCSKCHTFKNISEVWSQIYVSQVTYVSEGRGHTDSPRPCLWWHSTPPSVSPCSSPPHICHYESLSNTLLFSCLKN